MRAVLALADQSEVTIDAEDITSLDDLLAYLDDCTTAGWLRCRTALGIVVPLRYGVLIQRSQIVSMTLAAASVDDLGPAPVRITDWTGPRDDR